MDKDSGPSYFGLPALIISVLAAGVWFLAFTWLLTPFVPAETPWLVYLLSAYTSLCLTGVFFLAWHMFRIVLIDQKSRARD